MPERLRAPGRAGRADAAAAAGRLRAATRFRVELQRPFLRHDRALNRGLASLARRLGVPCVATGNVHAHSRERARLQDAFVAIREHATLDASEPRAPRQPRARARLAARRWRRASPTIRTRWRRRCGSPSGCVRPHAATSATATRAPTTRRPTASSRRCAADRVRRPLPAGHRCRDEALAAAGRGAAGHPQARPVGLLHPAPRPARARARGGGRGARGRTTARALLPPGRGRGSSVSSIVCYLTGLSHIDPIENELFLGRFLNEELTALPDIDLDFPRDIREKLIPRVHERYGSEHSALVAAFPTYRSRGAIREIGKALGLPPGEIERVARVAEPWAQSVEEDVNLALGAAAEAAEGTHSAQGAAARRRRCPRDQAARRRPARRPGRPPRRAAGRARAMGVATGPRRRPATRGDGAGAGRLRRQLGHGARGPDGADAGRGGDGGLRRRRDPRGRGAHDRRRPLPRRLRGHAVARGARARARRRRARPRPRAPSRPTATRRGERARARPRRRRAQLRVGAERRRPGGRGVRPLQGRWGVALAAGRGGVRAAAPPVPAPRRDDRLDAAAGRLRPARPRRDGGAADVPLGQGLVRGRGLPEDRPARARDAVGGRAGGGGDRAHAAASGSTSAASRTTTSRPTRRSRRRTRWASSRSRAARRCSRCCARSRRRWTT